MVLDIQKDICCGCMACESACKMKAITPIYDDFGFVYPSINKDVCVECFACEHACPIISNANIKNNVNHLAYAAYSIDEDCRYNSSSGGMFSVLASYIIKSGGVVYGAAMDESLVVKHIGIENLDGIEKIRGSKYIQSNAIGVYNEVKRHLVEDRIVYFSGTPCQVEALHSFLGKEYESLITQDIICHGVSSYNVLKKFLLNRFKKLPDRICFRDKKTGWKGYSFSAKVDQKKYCEPRSENMFMIAYLSNLCLRLSCYHCKFKRVNRVSDITLGDFWGINNILPNAGDKGVTLLIANTEKGKLLLDKINTYNRQLVDFNSAIEMNPCYFSSVDLPKDRELFLRDITEKNFEKVVNHYTKERSINVIKRKIKKRLRDLKILR